ncbi:MAG: hypothetical protein IJJ33_00125, partial [Victivallales bacterium]|nr:hypothetical protein [Victivallales bacterium]
IAMVKDTALPVNGLNGALTAEVACELCLPGQAPQWRKANLPWKNYSNWKDDEHLAMFWLGFPMFQNDGTPFCPTMPVALDLGPIFDVAAVFLNNQRIGLIGRFEKQEEPMFSEAACRACLQVPPEIWSRDGHNQLMIVVQRSRGIGGLPGVPGLCLSNPVENSSVARCREAFDSLVCSNRLEEAGDLLETHFGLAQADPVWFLSSRAYLSYLAWTDGGRADSSQPERLLADIAEILREHPSRSPRQSAMQAFCRVLRLAEDDEALLALVRRHFPHAMENSLALALDWESQGDWIPYRGYDMFILSSMGQVGDWYGGFLPFPYSRGIPGKRDTPRHWLDAAARRVHDASALLMPDKYRDAMFGEGEFSAKVPSGTGHFLPGQKVRRAAWWDDHGEMHPFDDDGPDLEAHIRETTEKKTHPVGVYDGL